MAESDKCKYLLSNGWVFGKFVESARGKIVINKNGKTKHINAEDFKEFANLGWEKGSIGIKRGTLIHNKKLGIQKYAKESSAEFKKLLEEGWEVGSLYEKTETQKKAISESHKNTVFLKNEKLKKERLIKDQEEIKQLLKDGWEYGRICKNTKDCVHLKNAALQRNKMVKRDSEEYYNLIDAGWVHGRILNTKSTAGYVWLKNLKSGKTTSALPGSERYIKLLEEGWVLKRK